MLALRSTNRVFLLGILSQQVFHTRETTVGIDTDLDVGNLAVILTSWSMSSQRRARIQAPCDHEGWKPFNTSCI
jgi:hypothetical protein